ncbi:MAG: insulinase family protein [Myxococcales bacterium]|nr:insulinase family protein [Myxococcales bacterium]
MEHYTLSNGVRAIVAPLPHLRRVCICVLVNVGARDETPKNNGLSHFVEHMLFRGSHRYPSPYALNSAIEEIGGDLYAATHTDFTHYQITLPSSMLEEGIDILAQTIQEPAFGNIELEKEIVRQELLGGLDEQGRDIDINNLSRELLFAPHPLSFPIAGSLETLASFTDQDVRHHYQSYYSGSNIVVCLSGALDPQKALSIVERCFSGMDRRSAPLRKRIPPTWRGPKWKYLPYDDSQSDVRICFDCPGELDSQVVPLQLLARILDDGMSSRLYRVLCEEQGLVYDVFGALELFEERGVYDIGVSIEQSKVPIVMQAITALLRDFRNHGLKNGELEKVKKRWIWDLESSVDYAEDRAFFFATRALLSKVDGIDALTDEIESASSKDIEALSNALFVPDRMHAACIGRLDQDLERRALDALEAL